MPRAQESSARSEPAPARQARSRRTRARILDAALAQLAAGGPAAVTHRAVAERVGVSVGAVLHHFASKPDLLTAVYQLHLDRVRARAETIVSELAFAGPGAGEAALRAQLIEGLTRYLEQGVRADRKGSLATFELALERARDPGLRRRLRRAQAESNDYAARMFEDLGSPTPEVDSELVIAALNGLRLAWLAEGSRSAFAERVPALVERLADLLSLSSVRGRAACPRPGGAR